MRPGQLPILQDEEIAMKKLRGQALIWKASVKTVWSGVLVATMLAAGVAAQSQPLEPLFRAGIVVSTTFKESPLEATVQPLKIEVEVAKAKATTVREKEIVSAYTFAMLDLSSAASAYEFSLRMATATAESKARTAAMKKEMERNLLPGAPRPGTRAAMEQEKQDKETLAEAIALAERTAKLTVREESTPKIEAALKQLEDAQALYTAKPTATAKPVAKPATKK
jgi:hypothetical protein